MNWINTKLGEFAPFVYGKGLPQSKRIAGDIPVYGSNGIVGTHSESFVKEPAVIIGRKGSVGEVHLSKGPSWPIDTAFFALSSRDVDLNFLYYLLKTLPITSNSDSAVPGLNRDFAHSLEIRVPDFHGQVAIGEILANMDAKITANENLSRTLESIAQTIFKSWFIDFDPVKAKMAGEKPVGLDTPTAALFPDSVEESELGLVPKGWEISSAGAFCPFKYGKALPASNRIFGAVPVYGSNGVVGNHNEALTLAPSIVIGRKGTVGTVNLEFGPCWIIDTAFYTSTAEPKDIYLAYLQLKTLGLNEMNSDGAVPGLNRDNAHRNVFTIGTSELRNTFAEVAHNLFTKIAYCHAENRSLIGIRDSLLPRLISGELQVPEEMLAS